MVNGFNTQIIIMKNLSKTSSKTETVVWCDIVTFDDIFASGVQIFRFNQFFFSWVIYNIISPKIFCKVTAHGGCLVSEGLSV